jgi:hypothetical protein
MEDAVGQRCSDLLENIRPLPTVQPTGPQDLGLGIIF